MMLQMGSVVLTFQRAPYIMKGFVLYSSFSMSFKGFRNGSKRIYRVSQSDGQAYDATIMDARETKSV